MLAALADANTSDRQEALAADRDGPGKPHRGGVSALSPLFPQAVAAPNIVYTGFTNANAMLHVANCVANAGRNESGDSYKFYAEGVTPVIARLYEAINAERVAVLRPSAPRYRPWPHRLGILT